MDGNEYSRREFLRRFAMLSSASLLGLNFGCSDAGPGAEYGPIALYGPAPVNNPMVSAIYFIDSQSNYIPLQNNQSVFILFACFIDFSKDMNTSAPTTMAFTDASGNAVPFTKSWINPRTLEVTPITPLQFNTTYTLSVGNDAEDILGNKITLTADATATFITGSP